MTYQIKNTVKIGANTYKLIGASGKWLYDPRNLGFEFIFNCTACRAGYVAEYTTLKINDNYYLYLTSLTCYGLQRINVTGTFPLVFGTPANHADNRDGSLLYSDLKEFVPFSGELYLEMGYRHHEGLRSPPEEADQDHSCAYRFENGMVTGYKELTEHNSEIWQMLATGVIKDPYSITEKWPERMSKHSAKGQEKLIELGKQILDNKTSARLLLCNAPYLESPEFIFEEMVVPALRERYDQSWNSGLPL